jgi:hypothetical protein
MVASEEDRRVAPVGLHDGEGVRDVRFTPRTEKEE